MIAKMKAGKLRKKENGIKAVMMIIVRVMIVVMMM
jgi:hypothetical protein